MIDVLKTNGTYDDTLIVVMADYGVTVRPDIYHRREATEDTIGDIAAIPLFIKYPDQEGGGVIDDYRAEIVDVLPTIADVLDVDIPWAVDGTSLLSGERPERTESQIDGSNGVITFGVDGSQARAIAEGKIDSFGTTGPFGLAPPGQADLLGVSIADVDVQTNSGTNATIRNTNAYADIDLDGPEIPSWISGVITPKPSDAGDLIVAVAVNGQIAAVTRTFVNDDRNVEYGALIPPNAFRDGANRVDLILVQGEGTDRTFALVGGTAR